MNTVSNTYIVWFHREFEAAEGASEALNGQVLRMTDAEYPEPADVVGERLRELGYSGDLVDAVLPVAEYIRNENVHESMPSRSDNCYSAAVVIPTLPDQENWLAAYRQPGFLSTLPDDAAREVFGGIMAGRGADYALLMQALSECVDGQPQDFLLVPVAANFGGYDDIAYLLKDVEYGPQNIESVLADKLDEVDAEWLYRRNSRTISWWMFNQGLGLEDFGHEHSRILEVPGKVRWEVVYRWTCHTVKAYLDSLK